MVNLTDRPIWNVDDSEVGVKIRRAVTEVHRICRSIIPVGTTGKQSAMVPTLKVLESKDLRTIDTWSIDKANKFIDRAAHTKDVSPPGGVDDIFGGIAKWGATRGFGTFAKLVVIQLWIDEVLIAPLNYGAPSNTDHILDALIANGENSILVDVRSVNKLSKFEYRGSDKLEDRNRRANHWFRLLLNTSFYKVESLTEDDIKVLLRAGSGVKSLLPRYYVPDFLLSITAKNAELKKTVSDLISGHKVSVAEAYSAGRAEKATLPPRVNKGELIPKLCLDYSSGSDPDISLEDLVGEVVGTINLRKVFGGSHADMGLPIYKGLPDKVRDFCQLINTTFSSFIRTAGQIKGDNYIFAKNIMMFYISVCLPRFYLDRDGRLEEYPTTLNEFSCPYYVTRDSLLDDVLDYDKKAPDTLISFVNLYSDLHDWVNDTLYARVLILEKYFQYIVDNRTLIPNSDKVTNTFTKANYPRTARRTGTAKKPIPRKYFSTFVGLLYTLEYLVTHLNAMADGLAPGSINGSLQYVTRAELEERHLWRGLWGKPGSIGGLLDLSLLNYTPIYLHGGKYRPLKKCHRFYSISEYEQKDGVPISYASPHEIRATILMCETGIRQKHLLWLDVDRYDCFVDRSHDHVLCPLLVNTDKAHDEWTAIVSARVIKVCDRQRDFYLNCGDPSFDENMWYSESEGAKFGKFKPLFRQPKAATSWTNHIAFPKLLWTLQHIIHEDLKEYDAPDLVMLASTTGKGERTEVIEYTEKSLSGYRIISKHTPHALRAGFVTEAIRFLPPSLIGECMTGQTESLVWYYTVTDPNDFTSHQQLLANYLSKNAEAISRGDAPELAATVAKVNKKLMSAIEADPAAAVEKYKLMSLTGISEDKTGLKLVLAKKHTKLAFNPSHICPFDNRCPKEVFEAYGPNRPCALCTYSIRGVPHLPAVSACKSKNFELMGEYQQKIIEYIKRPKSAQNASELEKLNDEHDNAMREATALEAIEQQLYALSESEDSNAYIVQEKDALVAHFEKVELNEAEHLIKRLVDVQNFPDLDSPTIQRKFAYLRKKLLINDGDLAGLLSDFDGETEVKLLTSQLKSMMDVKKLGVKEIFKIASSNPRTEQNLSSGSSIKNLLT
ncbi:MAG: hypothetical protein SCI25_07175 [Desulfuromonadales bacterium]|nr:hypothetical protein [Desulfuromonadales bacterium]MDW7756154.1 hypothetical protein [Desulfuromonadales bacterium]